MLRRDQILRMQIHELLDACLFAISFWLAYTLRTNPEFVDMFALKPVDLSSGLGYYTWMYLLLIPAAPMILEVQGFYNRPVLCSRGVTAWLLMKGCVFTALGLVVTLFLVNPTVPVPRWLVIWFAAISFLLVFVKEELISILLRSRTAQTQYRRRFILVGTSEETQLLASEIRACSQAGIDIVAQLDLSQTPLKRLIELMHELSVNGVIVSANRAYFEQVQAGIRACEIEGVEVWLLADFFKTQISRTTMDNFLGHPVLVFSSAPEASWQMLAKQLMDFVCAAVLLAICVPLLFLPLAVIIRLTSPGPVFFRQMRSGLNGRPFVLYKFRTMVTNAEQLQHELAAMNEMSGPVFKVTNDPRVTPLGKWLRKSSLDELPQLLNVLRGEMSLVGPRPLPVDEVKRFNDLAHRRRLSVRPGLTCLWQISGRNNVTDFKDWVRLDLEYIDHWSLWLDIQILLRTVPVVLLGVGAR